MGCTCECCPYGSQGILITAQVIMGITFFLSFAGWYLTWIFGLTAWILLLVLACAKVHRAVLIVSGVFALIAAAGQFILAGLVNDLNVYCNDSFFNTTTTFYSNNYTDDFYKNHYSSYSSNTATTNCHDTLQTIQVIAIISGIGWVISAILVLYLSAALKDKVNPTLSAWEK